MDNLHHHFARLYGCEHILSQSLCLYGVGEVLCYLVVDVGVKERSAHVLQGFRNVYLCYFALPLQELEAAFEPFAEVFKHI